MSIHLNDILHILRYNVYTFSRYYVIVKLCCLGGVLMIDIKEFLFGETKNKFNGIASICTSNYFVIKAAMEFAKSTNTPLLIESTSNQVNQFGGYTNMTPRDFYSYVKGIAKEVEMDFNSIMLGGDHLGPNPFQNEKARDAMLKASDMVRDYVLAGFKKIHIDCSMRLADDSITEKLTDDIIAVRTIELIKVSEEAYFELSKQNVDEVHPVYIVGSEVPIPGGAQTHHDILEVTRSSDLKNTYQAIKKELSNCNLLHVLEYIIAIVVQPGVEFSDEKIDAYNRANAKELTSSLKHYNNIVFEGHSTDYQTKENLKMMVQDGIRILKVGPQLTYALREAFYALSYIEKEMVHTNEQAYFIETLIKVMKENPINYVKHYKDNVDYQIKFSLLDRSRYYLNHIEVEHSIKVLLENLSKTPIKDSLLSQFLPLQYQEYRSGSITKKPLDLLSSKIKDVLNNYLYAIK